MLTERIFDDVGNIDYIYQVIQECVNEVTEEQYMNYQQELEEVDPPDQSNHYPLLSDPLGPILAMLRGTPPMTVTQTKPQFLTEALVEVLNNQWKVDAIESSRSVYTQLEIEQGRKYIKVWSYLVNDVLH